MQFAAGPGVAKDLYSEELTFRREFLTVTGACRFIVSLGPTYQYLKYKSSSKGTRYISLVQALLPYFIET